VQTRTVVAKNLKSVHSLIDQRTLLSAAMLRLTRWMADYYLCSWGQVLETVVPAGVRQQAGTRETVLLSVRREVAARLTQLELPEKQRRILTYLAASPKPLSLQQLAAATRSTPSPINALRKKGFIDSRIERVDTAQPTEAVVSREDHFTLNAEQRAALNSILDHLRTRQHGTTLIHGVTGSGKTEVYIHAIQEVLGYGRQAIVLVPEISLTPQTEQRFRSRFGKVAVLHSHQTDAQRHLHWQRIARGDVHVVVGPRSAVFAPVPNLGLIILDEEHETSFKQETAPRYNARDVALERARAENIPLVLGSATPSLESWQRAMKGEFRLVSMPGRVFDRPLPSVGTIDLRLDFRDRRNRGAISRQLAIAMEDALKDDGQVILLLNRRGYSTHIQCPACGLVVKCPACEIALTHHLQLNLALCHYCDYQVAAPPVCPECQFPGIRYSGLGTQRLEFEVKARFPDHRCLRMDSDTMQKPGSHEQALSAFRAGDVRILLGTQMIAKGLDFPNVTLVGVINADTALHLPDFRAAERTFQLVTQVAGRTGRGAKGGRVLVQTFSPEHPAIVAASRHDFAMFAAQELPIRETLAYPPFASMVRLIVRGHEELITGDAAAAIAERLQTTIAGLGLTARVLGPAPAPIAKLRGQHRFQIQAQAADGALLREAVRQSTAELNLPEGVQWTADVDPLDML
jgi:primosomal protein N' (replication factor Y)